jgi:hypothetical protein
MTYIFDLKDKAREIVLSIKESNEITFFVDYLLNNSFSNIDVIMYEDAKGRKIKVKKENIFNNSSWLGDYKIKPLIKYKIPNTDNFIFCYKIYFP